MRFMKKNEMTNKLKKEMRLANQIISTSRNEHKPSI